MNTARERFLDYVRTQGKTRPVVSPFLPLPDVVIAACGHLGLPVKDDYIANEVAVAKALDYEPMFMSAMHELIFPWREDETRSDEENITYVIDTPEGEWTNEVSRAYGMWGDESGFPVRTEEDFDKLVVACRYVGEREDWIREYFRDFRSRVGEDGVIVIGHPTPSWLCFQSSQQNLFYHWLDYKEKYIEAMDAIFEASLKVFEIGMSEGIDFMSCCGYGLEMTNMEIFTEADVPIMKRYSAWVRERDGLMWYHNCGMTRKFIEAGLFNELGAHIIETFSPPPAGDNADLAYTRSLIDSSICTKGNLDLGLLRDGSPDDVKKATEEMVESVRGSAHVYSTADAVLPGTPPENFIAFCQTARECGSRRSN